ncbi:Aste57867_23942 [Aphanomyces stellatus]|uniref:Aste57867_23942 protein n=1 Tax=Aphanomyces stellatus TaxID=120398 RepID=A0A485LNY6_9STRA|nr:hypothetical protein As57867_023869 [Aphanomyces stellatus]VFU00585.1 Aste57867_23942 [Aphanomyces stellatus]
MASGVLCVAGVNVSGDTTCSRNDWEACDIVHLDFTLPAIPWVIFAVTSLVFVWFTNVWKEFQQGIHELHDIPAQGLSSSCSRRSMCLTWSGVALGIVVARQKKRLLGKEVTDPRRILMLVAMWAELPGFSYLPLELLYHQYAGTYLFASSAMTQMYKFVASVALLTLLALASTHKYLASFQVKVLQPLIFDALYVVFLYAILDVLTCSSSLDTLVLPTGGSCACRDQIWSTAVAAALVFFLMYAGALVYRVRLSDDVFGVRFRYPMSFSCLMTFLRTGSCLFFMTIILVLDSTPSFQLVNLAAGAAYFVLFASLFRYNYLLQPCLGSGLFPNNMRALSFATSCWISLTLVVATLDPTNVVIPITCLALYPLGAIAVWRVNSARARQYHIQNLPLTETLKDPNLRVRTVAIVSITLEDYHRWTDAEVNSVVKLLQASLSLPAVAEDGLLVAYACQATWILCCKYGQLTAAMADRPAATYIPFHLWTLPTLPGGGGGGGPSMKSRHSNVSATTRLQDLVDRNAMFNTRSGISTVAPLPLAAATYNDDDVALPGGGEALNESLLQQCLVVALSRATAILELPFPQACNVAAKMLQEMYAATNVQLTLGTWLSVVSTLCGNYNADIAAAAAASLCTTMLRFPPQQLMPFLCDRAKLDSISKLLTTDNALVPMYILREKIVGGVLVQAATHICRLAPNRDPATFYSSTFLTHLHLGWKHWQKEYPMTLSMEELVVMVQKASITFRAMARHKKKKQHHSHAKSLQGSGGRSTPGNSSGRVSDNQSESSRLDEADGGGPRVRHKPPPLRTQHTWAGMSSEMRLGPVVGPESTNSGSLTFVATPRHASARRKSLEAQSSNAALLAAMTPTAEATAAATTTTTTRLTTIQTDFAVDMMEATRTQSSGRAARRPSKLIAPNETTTTRRTTVHTDIALDMADAAARAMASWTTTTTQHVIAVVPMAQARARRRTSDFGGLASVLEPRSAIALPSLPSSRVVRGTTPTNVDGGGGLSLNAIVPATQPSTEPPRRGSQFLVQLSKLRTGRSFRDKATRGRALSRVVDKFRRQSITAGGDALLKSFHHFAKANQPELVPAALWKEVKLRRAVRQRGLAHAATVLTEGFQAKLLPQLLSPPTVQALRTLVALLETYPFLHQHFVFALPDEELRYLLFAKHWMDIRDHTQQSLAATPHRWARFAHRVKALVRPLAAVVSGAAAGNDDDDDGRGPPRIKRVRTSAASMRFPRVNFVRERGANLRGSRRQPAPSSSTRSG